jgi:hypothetical protein
VRAKTPTKRRTNMAYNVMIWLVNPGSYPQQDDEEVRLDEAPDTMPGAHSGANIGHALPRMVYGVYESQGEAEGAFSRTLPCGSTRPRTGSSSSPRTGCITSFAKR